MIGVINPHQHRQSVIITQAVQVYADWQYDRIAVPSTDTDAGLIAENTALKAELSAIKNAIRELCMEVNG